MQHGMNTNMTNFCEATTSHDEDPDAITLTTSYQDDGDTSFEIDEPEDEEIIDGISVMGKRHSVKSGKEIVDTTLTHITDAVIDRSGHKHSIGSPETSCKACAATNLRSYAVVSSSSSPSTATAPHIIAQTDQDDPGEQSDASSTLSHTISSSTPTTADVADVTAVVMSPYTQRASTTVKLFSPAHSHARGAHSSQLHVMSNGPSSITEDNLSCSIATTTTDIVDMDNVGAASPRAVQHLQMLHHTGAPVAAPAAVLQQNDITVKGGDRASTSQHMRTLSSSSYRSIHSQHGLPPVQPLRPDMPFYDWIRRICINFKSSGIGEPSVYHALVVIFLEFFAWGLLTMPVISVLNQTFPDHTFLMNGLVMGIKGILSFLSAPLIGALSDIWGRKFFLLITVFFTCAPIPLMTINTWWFFAMISISGVFAVTFSVVFAYVADVTTVEERSRAYGLVSATFAASLVISPALGAVLMEWYSDTLVVALATAIAVLDVFFILVAVPESLPEKVRPSSWGAPISWEQADPFAALRKVGTDHTILMQCVTVLLSYLPEAGQYSCIFVYLKLKMGFNAMEVAIFIAVVGILSISVQVTLGCLMRAIGAKNTIILGLILEMFQLLWYGFGNEAWMMWAAGVLAALGSITYPAISAFVSIHSTADRQGAVQGMVTGMRGLCNGLGPAMFGVIFYLFNVDLNDLNETGSAPDKPVATGYTIPGPPFVFGAFMVLLAILVAIYIPEDDGDVNLSRAPSEKKRVSVDVQYEIESGHKSTSPLSPLMRSDSLAQL